MARFKHTGARLEQLRNDSIKRNTGRMMELAENQLGRSLTPKEMKGIAEQAKDVFGNLPVYGGE